MAPHMTSYLGIIVIWYEKEEIYQAILEFTKYVIYHPQENLLTHCLLNIDRKMKASTWQEYSWPLLDDMGLKTFRSALCILYFPL